MSKQGKKMKKEKKDSIPLNEMIFEGPFENLQKIYI